MRFAESESFEAELRVYVQRRLVLATRVLGLAGAGLLVVSRLADVANHGLVAANQVHPSVVTHAVAVLIAFGLHAWLKRRPLSGPALVTADTVITEALVAVCLAIYAFSYQTGIHQVVPLLGLLLIARAIVLPSRPRRTLWLSLSAPLGILAIQLAHGRAYTVDGRLFPQGGFAAYVLWDQATLWLAVGLAGLTSRVVYAARVQAHEFAKIGRYTLEERIGGGAIGEVYRARHALMRRPVALKILRPEVASGRNLELFEQEVQRTSELTHPNTVQVFDYGLTPEGLFYYAMEFLDGADLERVVEIGGAMPAARVLHVLRQACGSLEEAHAAGLIHCDLKPANLFLCRRGGHPDVLKVLDFGLARNVRRKEEAELDGAVFGTPQTMPPEVIRGRTITPATDLYSLGAVGYFLLTGQPVFDGASLGEVLRRHLGEEPTPPSGLAPDVPADLEDCLLQCLAKDPAVRPATASALREALCRCDGDAPWTPGDAERWWAMHAAALTDGRGTGEGG
jgi:serine/threonine-protein kinase